MTHMRKEKLYDKAWKRTERDTIDERDMGYGRLKDYGKGYDVEMFWDLSEEAKRDQMFKVRIRGRGLDNTVDIIFDSEEFKKYLRWV